MAGRQKHSGDSSSPTAVKEADGPNAIILSSSSGAPDLETIGRRSSRPFAIPFQVRIEIKHDPNLFIYLFFSQNKQMMKQLFDLF